MENNPTSKKINIDEFFDDPMFISRSIQAGMNKELLKHKQAGNPVCTWRDGKVVWIPAEEIQIDSTGMLKGPYLTPDEAFNREQGKFEGKREFLIILLSSKFGQVSEMYLNKLTELTADEIQDLFKKALISNTIEEAFN